MVCGLAFALALALARTRRLYSTRTYTSWCGLLLYGSS